MKKFLQKIYILFLSLIILSGSLSAQVTYTVTVSDFSFTPSSLTVNANDTVLFQWISGNHSVESSTNAWTEFAINSTSTTYKWYGFSPSTYNYRSANNRAMTGSITVNAIPSSNTVTPSKYEMIVSPNPFEDEVTLTINPGNKHLTAVRIFDLIGKEVAHIDLKNKTGLISYRLDFSRLNPGVYFCNVYSDSGIVETKKLFRTK
jgi:plastocyanin